MKKWMERSAFIAVMIVSTVLWGQQAFGFEATATERPYAQICFPKQKWDAYWEDQPCDLIERPAEDGSGKLWLGTLGADAAVCHIPAPYEARHVFAIVCHRVKNE